MKRDCRCSSASSTIRPASRDFEERRVTEDVVIDCTAIDRMAEEAARINRENRREIRRLQRVVSALRYILGALVAVSIAFAVLWWLA